MNEQLVTVPIERIEKPMFLIRGEKVMLDRELAALYGVSTKVFNQAVKRHNNRFPPDFMFQLTMEEAQALRSRSQSVTLKRGQNIKYRPYAFTEHGILMLSSVLNSERAVQVNIEITHMFVGCDRCCLPTLNSQKSWRNWNRNTIANLRLCSTRFGN